MGKPPPAHRRLVPRAAKPVLEDSETSEHVVVLAVGDDDDDDDDEQGAPPVAPGWIERPGDSMEMTAVRPQFLVQDEVTIRKPFAGLVGDDDDADDLDGLDGLDGPGGGDDSGDDSDDVETGFKVPAAPDDGLDPDADADDEPDATETLARMLAEKIVPKFSGTSDVDAFADLEPTALKPATNPDTEDRPMAHVSPAERGLLAAMAEGHEASRLVYVTWLERRGEVGRAEFLRLDHALAAMSPDDSRHAPMHEKLLALAPKISVDWRSRVARSLIEGCTTTTGRCPAYWRALPNDTDDVRGCGVCGEAVYYCVSMDLARARLAAGERVAVDVTCDRRPPPELRCSGCSAVVPPDTRFCPHCGRRCN